MLVEEDRIAIGIDDDQARKTGLFDGDRTIV